MKDLNTPESAGKELLEGYKAGLKADKDADLNIHNDLQRIGKELHNICQELKTLNRRIYNR